MHWAKDMVWMSPASVYFSQCGHWTTESGVCVSQCIAAGQSPAVSCPGWWWCLSVHNCQNPSSQMPEVWAFYCVLIIVQSKKRHSYDPFLANLFKTRWGESQWLGRKGGDVWGAGMLFSWWGCWQATWVPLVKMHRTSWWKVNDIVKIYSHTCCNDIHKWCVYIHRDTYCHI